MADPKPDTKPAIVLSPRDSVAKALGDYFSPANRQSAIAKMIQGEALSVDSVTTSAIAEVIRTESLWPCTPQSIFDCVLAATALQLRVGKDLGHAYMVPFRDKSAGTTIATFMLGYRGLVTLARRSGEIASITANVVHKNDAFDASEGTDGHLRHSPRYFDPKGRGDLVGVYAYAKLSGGGEQWAIMSLAEVEAIRARSKAGGSGPWVTDFAEMAKKTVVRRLCKMLPISVEAQEVVRDDEEREFNAARDVTEPRATGPVLAAAAGGGERIRTPTQADKVREEVGEEVGVRPSTSSTPVNEETGETTLDPEPPAKTEPAAEKPKASRKGAEPKPDVEAKATPAEAPAKKADPGAGLAEASTLIDNADAATEGAELDEIRAQLDAAVAAGRIGVTHATRVTKAIDSAKARI